MVKKKVKVELSGYELEWLEQALAKQERGMFIDEGTLSTLGQIFLNGVKL
jgi:hypothetical protein